VSVAGLALHLPDGEKAREFAFLTSIPPSSNITGFERSDSSEAEGPSVLESLAACYRRDAGADSSINVLGYEFTEDDSCRDYLRDRVAGRLRASEGAAVLKDHLEDLGDTGFDLTSLQEQVVAPPAPKDWEVGETLAEVVLEDAFDGRFPWPTTLDKRIPTASLPGPDIVGFHLAEAARFLFGEVKSSSEATSPPRVVTLSNEGLVDQLRRLLTSPSHRQQLIGWLLVKSRDTEWEDTMGQALVRYFSENDAWIVGVLVRGGVEVSDEDLTGACDTLGAIDPPGDVALVAIYLPFKKDEWAGIVAQAGGEA
jgi:hypothetical protein